MKIFLPSLALALIAAAPALAGDAALGEKGFAKCKACHSIIAPDGTVTQKGGKVGPNLYGVIGRQIGTFPDFNYSAGTIAAGADGTVWDEATLAAYLVDPSAWIEEKIGDPAAKSKMTLKLPKGGEDIAAYLASVAPPPAAPAP
jgi:cytochrome c